jgi:hypothetical protein
MLLLLQLLLLLPLDGDWDLTPRCAVDQAVVEHVPNGSRCVRPCATVA